MYANRVFVLSFAFAFLLALGVLVRVDPVLAQQSDERQVAQDVEEVVVIEASIDKQLGERPPTSYKTDSVVLERRVSYADLDLGVPADVQELEYRIEMAAQEACETAEKSFPVGQKNMADVKRCIKKAIKGTKETFDAVVARAN